ncbi:hypothetical protein Tco_0398673, partial [Tanacetum coccineum]
TKLVEESSKKVETVLEENLKKAKTEVMEGSSKHALSWNKRSLKSKRWMIFKKQLKWMMIKKQLRLKSSWKLFLIKRK